MSSPDSRSKVTANRSYWEVEPMESAKSEPVVKFLFPQKKTSKALQVVKQRVGGNNWGGEIACKEFHEQDASADWKLMR